jgi:small subunit ribosomal protein S20
MANHKSALKRIRSSERKRLRNKMQVRTARTAIKELKSTKDKAKATELLRKVYALVDKLAKKNIIHKNNASNKKSKLAKLVNRLAA